MVISFRYGDINVGILDPSLSCNNSKPSLWWIELRLSLGFWCLEAKWFTKGILCKAGKGNEIDIWRAHWLGVEPHYKQFPYLFTFSHEPGVAVNS